MNHFAPSSDVSATASDVSVRVRPPATRWLLAAACVMSVMSVGAQGQTTLTVTNTNNDGVGSLRDILSQATTGAVINFAVGGRIELTSQLELNSGVTINGTGVTLDGVDQTTRLLRINAPGNTVTINNLTFVNGGVAGGDGANFGFTGGGGGAGLGAALLADAGNIVLDGTVFQNNVVVGGDGGEGNDNLAVAAFPSQQGSGAGGGGLGAGIPGPGENNLADGQVFVLQAAAAPGGAGGTAELLVQNDGGNAGLTADTNGEDGTAGTDNDGGGGGGGLAIDGSGGDGGAGGLGSGGGGGGAAPLNDAGNPLAGRGGDGGFGGGGGGGQSNFILNPDADLETRGGLAGEGGGSGELNADDPNSAAAGGGGGGLGAAIFIDEDASLVLRDVDFLQQTNNLVTAGVGGSAFAGDGDAAGAFLFVRGGVFEFEVNEDQTIDFTLAAPELFISDTSQTIGSAASPNQPAGFVKTGEAQLRFVGDNDVNTDDLSLGLQHTLIEGSINLDASFSSFEVINITPAAFNGETTFFGNGSFGSILNQTGRVNPGDGEGQIGTLTVNVQFDQEAGGNLDIEVGGGQIDLLRVVNVAGIVGGGEADLNGNVNFIEIAPGTPLDTPLVFLEANDISGEFDNVTTLFLDGDTLTTAAITAGTVIDPVFGLLETREATFTEVEATDVLEDSTGRTASGGLGSFVGGLLSSTDPTEVALGNEILTALSGGEGLATNGAFTPLFVQGLESQTAVVQNALASAAASAGTLANNVVRSRVSGAGVGRTDTPDRLLLDIRSYDDLFSGRVAPEGSQQVDSFAFDDESALGEEDSAFETRPFSLWVEAVAGRSQIDADANGLGSESDTAGITAGAEWLADDGRTVAGLFVSSTETDIDVDDLSDSGSIDSVLIGVYGATPLGDGLSVNGSVSVGILDFDSSRVTGAGTAQASSDGVAINGSIELLKSFALDRSSVLSPFVGLEGSFVDRDGFTESGAGVLNLDVDSENDEYLAILTGVQWVGRYDVGTDLRLKPAVRVGVGFQLLDESASTTSGFTATPGTSFTSTGAERGTTSVRVGAGLELGSRYNNRWAVFARYTGDFSSGGNDNIGQFGVRFAF